MGNAHCIYCGDQGNIICDDCEGACEVCGSPVEDASDSHCKRCNKEYEDREASRTDRDNGWLTADSVKEINDYYGRQAGQR